MTGSSGASAIIDQIYELLDGIERDLGEIGEDSDRKKTELYLVPSITEAVGFLASYNYEGRLGLSQTDLAKFDAEKGTVPAGTLRQLGRRLRSLLKEFEGELARETPAAQPTPESISPEKISEPSNTEVRPFVAQQWMPLPRATNAALLTELSALLHEVIYLASNTNLPPQDRALSDLDRAQIIVLLETTLALLKAPLIEKGLLKRLRKAAESGADAALEKQSERALGFALGKLGESLARLLGLLG